MTGDGGGNRSTKVAWDMMIAFGSDEEGTEFLTAVKAHCCTPDAALDLPALARAARAASRDAGHGLAGKQAAWRVLEQAGLVLLPRLMQELGVHRRGGPRAAFYCAALDQTCILGFDWRLVHADEVSEKS